jgi:hypothetical protein
MKRKKNYEVLIKRNEESTNCMLFSVAVGKHKRFVHDSGLQGKEGRKALL